MPSLVIIGGVYYVYNATHGLDTGMLQSLFIACLKSPKNSTKKLGSKKVNGTHEPSETDEKDSN